MREASLPVLRACINQRVLVGDFMDPRKMRVPPNVLSYEVQMALLPLLENTATHNPYYIKLFLKKYIQLIEEDPEIEVSDEIYDLYCSRAILGSREMGPTETDTLLYWTGGFGEYADENESSYVKMIETPKIISGHGTTGLRTWQAALYLANYLNSDDFDVCLTGKTICELGAGTGLVSLALLKKDPTIGLAHVTDGDATLVEKLQGSIELNGVARTRVAASQLLWGTTNPGDHENFERMCPEADLVVAADVTYDSRILTQLTSTIRDFFKRGTQLALICATVRNTETINAWEAELGRTFAGKWSVLDGCLEPGLLDERCWFSADTPPINIYRIAAGEK